MTDARLDTPAPSKERWELVRLARVAGRNLRWGLRLLALGTVLLLAAQLASVYRLFHDLHPWAGAAAAVGFAALVGWLLVWPIVRLARLPRALDPPELPELAERDASHVDRQLTYLDRYLRNLEKNPQLAGHSTQLRAAREEWQELQRACRTSPETANQRIVEFEKNCVLPLLAPLDAQADAVIRREALAIGSLTALSQMGTVDAFLVLWRDLNLVATISRIYYGRPGLRGTWQIVRDVGGAILLSSVLEQLSHMGTGVVRKMGEGVVSAVFAPILDGTINALMTMKIGMLAKERCRSFQAWDKATTRGVVRETFHRVSESAGGLAKELNDLVGNTVDRVRAGADVSKDVLVSFSSRTMDVLRGLRKGLGRTASF